MERKRDFSWLKKNWRVLILCGCLFAGFLLGMLIFGSPWHLPPAWGDIPTWITALATFGLLIGATITAIYATRAFREQSKEVADQAAMLNVQSEQLAEQRKVNAEQIKVLELQAKELQESLDERERDRAQRRRAQASRVLLWKDRAHERDQGKDGYSGSITAYASNTSDLPAYGLEFRWHKGTAPWGAPDFWPDLMPGDTKEFRRPLPAGLPDSVDRSLFGAALRFRDAAGITWIRTPDGGLTEQQ